MGKNKNDNRQERKKLSFAEQIALTTGIKYDGEEKKKSQKVVSEYKKETDNNQQKFANEFFINPYTFVPIQAKNPDRHKVETGDKTGVIECVLETKSPVFIPNTTKKYETETKEHYKYEFYSYDDLSETTKNTAPKKPVIPGSEIRGVI